MSLSHNVALSLIRLTNLSVPATSCTTHSLSLFIQGAPSPTSPYYVYPGRKSEKSFASTSSTDLISFKSAATVPSVKQASSAKSQLLPPITSGPQFLHPSQASVRKTSAQFSTPQSLIQQSAPTTHTRSPSVTAIHTKQGILEYTDQHTKNASNYDRPSFEPVGTQRDSSPSPPLLYTQREKTHTSPYLLDKQDVRGTALQASPLIDARKRSQYRTEELSPSVGKQPARTIVLGSKAKMTQESKAVTFDLSTPEEPGQVSVTFGSPEARRPGHELTEDGEELPPASAFRQQIMDGATARQQAVFDRTTAHIQNGHYRSISPDIYFRHGAPVADVYMRQGSVGGGTVSSEMYRMQDSQQSPPIHQHHQYFADVYMRQRTVDGDVQRRAQGSVSPDTYRRQFENADIYRREVLEMSRMQDNQQSPQIYQHHQYEDMSSETKIFNSPISSMTSSLYSETLKANLRVSISLI